MSHGLPPIDSAARFRNNNMKTRRLREGLELSEYEKANARMHAQLQREERATRRFVAALIVVAFGSAALILGLLGSVL